MTKIAVRNAWFQVHKWIGLILAILIIPLSVTGAALVWDDALDHMLNPVRYATTGVDHLILHRKPIAGDVMTKRMIDHG